MKKIEIEFFVHLAGGGQPFMFQHRGEKEAVPVILECPVVVHWEGWEGNRDGSTMGCLEIPIEECMGNFHMFKNIDYDKLLNWILQELEALPEDKRKQEWVRRVSVDTIKLWLK